ncbi:molybdopterin-dependent oxidoreductase [Nocardioides sp. cx-173]|uniref:molybdopterin-dependent oxidoreductase n=1 Tax=Nocardioides sp. cx-173 TaxID=2898796 RepID=UPI001E65A405|nr:molybdopterin-dependent oxidoreductase [Nocardioides sp. cx-173]MCD4526503.1 molybdopterin-dependent oxidoreductase [Nocardioides sp. cx-173]UGB41190.1 molybdopterin-dependent oxidoreductase [Nocardioides sp. cx-173]
MTSTRGAWSLAGILAGAAGLATSYLTANLLSIRESPVVAVAEDVIRLTPGPVAEAAIDLLGHRDKAVLVAGILVVVTVLFAVVGHLARRSWWAPVLILTALALAAATAVLLPQGTANATDALPVLAGFVTWLVALSLLAAPLRTADAATESTVPGEPAAAMPESSRRGFLIGAGAVAGTVAVAGVLGRFVGAGRREVERIRGLLRLPGVSAPQVPPRAIIGAEGISPWLTSATDFYRIDTAIAIPVVNPSDWRLRIQGLVDREIELTFDELNAFEKTEAWVTLNCVSNPVGGDLIGNAWWSGVRVATLLADAGVQPGADAVLQTSEDGWTCGTPLEALTDDRDAMLAVAMNGKPLPIEHGFPVRTIVPGLYGYVSATKWVVDLEVTRFADIQAYWTEKGWAERGPVKLASRIDVPDSGAEVAAGEVAVAGVAWAQHTGISAVEVAVDGGAWQRADLADPGTIDTWVQWRAVVDLEPGEHRIVVRATDAEGLVQTDVERDVLPDGATGRHGIDLSVSG